MTGSQPLDVAALLQMLQQQQLQIADLSTQVQRLQAQTETKTGSAPSPMPFLSSHETLEMKKPVSVGSRLNGRAGGTAATRLESSGTCAPEEQQLQPAVPMAATRVVMTQLVSPAESNGMNICMGGTVLSWIDICAGLAAKTLARRPVVTASLDTVHFLRPCHVGSVVIIAAMVNRTFSSSMEVGVRVEEECPRSGARYHCCSAYLTFVALSDKRADGAPAKKIILPKVTPGSFPYFADIHREAELRREARLQQRERLRSDPELAAQEAECRLPPITHMEGQPTLPPALRLDAAALVLGGRRRIKPSVTAAHMTQLIMPQHANSIGITFGGQVMRWMEQCAFISASRVCRGSHLLTAGMDGIAFSTPTRVGDIMYIEAQVTAIFGSSVEVMISVWGETPHAGEMFGCGDAYATIVSVDEKTQPQDIPFQLVPETRAEQLRYQAAVRRRQERLHMREKLQVRAVSRLSLDGAMARKDAEEDALLNTLAGPGQGSTSCDSPRASVIE